MVSIIEPCVMPFIRLEEHQQLDDLDALVQSDTRPHVVASFTRPTVSGNYLAWRLLCVRLENTLHHAALDMYAPLYHDSVKLYRHTVAEQPAPILLWSACFECRALAWEHLHATGGLVGRVIHLVEKPSGVHEALISTYPRGTWWRIE